MTNKFRDKKWWKYAISIGIAIKIAVVIIALGSLKSESEARLVNEKITAFPIPEEASFAGEKMPLRQFDVREALDRELISNAYFHSQTIRMIKIAPRYLPVIEPILKSKGVPDDFKYLAMAESALNTRAVSPAGAVGFWQFLEGTGKDYGLEINAEIDERYNIEKSTNAFCDYLKDSYKKFGSWTLAAAAYNGGNARVQRQIERQKQNDFYNLLFAEETTRYIFRIVAIKTVMQNPEKYNFDIDEGDKYTVIKTRDVEISGPVSSFADFAISQGINYKLLKEFNPWLRDDKLTNSKSKTYTVKIPVLK